MLTDLTYKLFYISFMQQRNIGSSCFPFHGHCPRKDHHGNLFTSFTAFYS